MTTLNGHTLTQFQRCKRIHIIDKTHTFNKWRPQSLLAAVLRHAIFNLSNGKELEQVTSVAVNNFLGSAKNPGLDVSGIDVYTLAMDYCAIIRNILEFLSRLSLLTLQEVPPVSLSSLVSWQLLSYIDEAGVLHKWQFVDYISEDVLPELHSWEVFGDIAAYDAPMMLHMVAIGSRKGCHQSSPWCRIYAHPKLPKVYKFQKRAGTQLEGEWKPTYFSSNSDNSPKEWVDWMLKDNVINTLVRHVQVREVSPQHKKMFKADVLEEAANMAGLDKYSPRDVAMSRYACDRPYTCPHQLFCYGDKSLDDVGVYRTKRR